MRYSNVVCPPGMSLEQWQVALRVQQAQTERFEISTAGMPGEYCVRNPRSRSEYKVVYRGPRSEWNYCSCMDFKASCLGTCKHIEAVRLAGAPVCADAPAYTSVYLDYTAGRSVRIRFGTEHEQEFRMLAAGYFGLDNCLLDEACSRFGDFLKAAKEIDPSFRCYPDALDYVLQFRARRFRADLVERKCSDEALDKLLDTTLYPYQKEGVRFALKAGKCIIADEMGLGKTPQAIAVAEFLRREGLAGSALIVVPTSLKYQWKKEIEHFVPGAEVLVIEGPQYKRKEMYGRDVPYRIVSYNAACNDIKVLGGLSCDLLILDEVQRLKNWNTQIARAARKIDSQYSVILSGTPLENKLEELYSIVELADQYLLAPYFRFKDQHIVTDPTGKVTGYRNLNAVGEKLRNLLIRRRKADVNLQLPERVDKNLFVPMTHAQREMHDTLRMDVAKQIQKWQRNHFLSEMDRRRLMLDLSRMRMVCDSTYLLDQESRDDTKLDEVINIICDIYESGDEKVLIFSQWERMTRLVAYDLEARGIRFEYLHGAVTASKRKDMVTAFSEDPDIRVFLSTDAGSTGLNLQAASTVINLDLPWNPAVLEQRIARVHRIGQSHNIQVINLISANSIEENMIAKLRFKSSLFEGVLDGGEDSVFIGEDKFKKIIDVVGEYVAAELAAEPAPDVAEPAAESAPDVAEPAAGVEPEDEGSAFGTAAGVEPEDEGLAFGTAAGVEPEDEGLATEPASETLSDMADDEPAAEVASEDDGAAIEPALDLPEPVAESAPDVAEPAAGVEPEDEGSAFGTAAGVEQEDEGSATEPASETLSDMADDEPAAEVASEDDGAAIEPALDLPEPAAEPAPDVAEPAAADNGDATGVADETEDAGVPTGTTVVADGFSGAGETSAATVPDESDVSVGLAEPAGRAVAYSSVGAPGSAGSPASAASAGSFVSADSAGAPGSAGSPASAASAGSFVSADSAASADPAGAPGSAGSPASAASAGSFVSADPAGAPGPAVRAEDLISRSSALISDLVDTLKSPEATRALVDRLVVEDPDTGRSELRIPVRDKSTVASALRLLSELLNR